MVMVSHLPSPPSYLMEDIFGSELLICCGQTEARIKFSEKKEEMSATTKKIRRDAGHVE